MIEPIAAAVNIPKTDIYANSFMFNEDGSWKCHDGTEPTSRAVCQIHLFGHPVLQFN